MRGQKELHSVRDDKKLLLLFSEEELKLLEKNGVTVEAFNSFTTKGVDMKKCCGCKKWNNLRTLFHLYDMTSCAPCVPESAL